MVCAGVLTIDELQKLLRRGTTVKLDAALQPGAAGEIELTPDINIAVRKGGVDKGAANLLQGLDIDESLGLEQVDEQIRDYLSQKGVRVIELFRQWDDDGTGKIEKKEFRRGMKELGLTVGKKQLDELFDMWDPDKSGALTVCGHHCDVWAPLRCDRDHAEAKGRSRPPCIALAQAC